MQRILVSIVVSIPACHAGDPGTIPGREASFCSHLLFCSSALLLPPALLLFCSSALLLFCSSALLFFAALFPAVRAPQPTSLMLPTHSWRIGTSAAVESDSPTRTKIDTCTAPYSSILVSIVVSIPACHAGDPGTIPGREASFCSHLLFCSSALLLFCSSALLLFCSSAPTCSSALLLFCSSALLPPPTLLLFCSSALLFFAAFFPAVRAPQPTSLMLPTHSWRIGTSAAVESDSPTRTKIDTCTAPYSSILVSIVVSIPACHAGDPGTIPGREASFCSHLLFCSSALLLPPALLLFCSSALLPPPTLLLFCSSALLFFAAFFPAVRAPQPTSLMLPTHSWRIGTSAAVESDSPTRTKIDTCTAPYSSLVEDAGETCLVARSGDEGMVERWLVYPPVTRVTRVQFPDGKLLFAPTCSSALLPPPTLLLFCSSALLLFCFAFLCCSLSCRSRTTTDISHATNAQLAHRHLCCCRIGLTNADEDRHVHGAVLVIGRGCGRNVFGGAEWRRGILVSIVVSIPACHAGDPGTIPGREASFCSHLLFCSSALLLPPALLLFCSSALLPPPTLLLFCSSALLFFAAFFPAVRAPQPTSLMLPTHSWRIGTSAAVESDSPTRTKIDTCTAPYSSLVEDAGETCLVARSGDEGFSLV
ncbi:hypothetical protein P3T76_016437 [Phytophthora citrophthora]|uniref:Transmembrane protein n=1 Tax=Phytophthora citrophthora TaxID=4793 RepID=A0AAD9LA38_9STRA|nr:hypothetical protein P3T76_016437 [Phytophthora citrophthora]